MQDKIFKSISNKYKSFESPDYGFVKDVFESNPYENLIGQLSEHFQLKDITDINYDVAFFYTLESTKRCGR